MRSFKCCFSIFCPWEDTPQKAKETKTHGQKRTHVNEPLEREERERRERNWQRMVWGEIEKGNVLEGPYSFLSTTSLSCHALKHTMPGYA